MYVYQQTDPARDCPMFAVIEIVMHALSIYCLVCYFTNAGTVIIVSDSFHRIQLNLQNLNMCWLVIELVM